MDSAEERIQSAWIQVRDTVQQMLSEGLSTTYKSLKSDEQFDMKHLQELVELWVNPLLKYQVFLNHHINLQL